MHCSTFLLTFFNHHLPRTTMVTTPKLSQCVVVDMDECLIPDLAARCVQNAECCNLPASFECRCLPGFTGHGEKECIGTYSSIY